MIYFPTRWLNFRAHHSVALCDPTIARALAAAEHYAPLHREKTPLPAKKTQVEPLTSPNCFGRSAPANRGSKAYARVSPMVIHYQRTPQSMLSKTRIAGDATW
jgi:hypothetical protein